MVRVVFIDGSEEVFESHDGTYEYMPNHELFRIGQNGNWVMIPREFVKYITVIEV